MEDGDERRERGQRERRRHLFRKVLCSRAPVSLLVPFER